MTMTLSTLVLIFFRYRSVSLRSLLFYFFLFMMLAFMAFPILMFLMAILIFFLIASMLWLVFSFRLRIFSLVWRIRTRLTWWTRRVRWRVWWIWALLLLYPMTRFLIFFLVRFYEFSSLRRPVLFKFIWGLTLWKSGVILRIFSLLLCRRLTVIAFILGARITAAPSEFLLASFEWPFLWRKNTSLCFFLAYLLHFP
jgi:hypothetical protein